MRYALFLGAGASKPFGYPLTKEIFPEIWKRLDDENKTLFLSGELHPEKMDRLKELLLTFFPGIGHKGVQLPLVTDALSLVDALSMSSVSPGPRTPPQQAAELRALLERGILSVLRKPLDQQRYDKFKHLLRKLGGWVTETARDQASSVSIITTNYDLLVEDEIYRTIKTEDIPTTVDFGVSWREPVTSYRIFNRPNDARIGVYKLHGSMNWLRCPLCQHIYIDTAGMIYQKAYRDGIDDNNTCHCEYAPLQPIVVTPSFIRAVGDPNLLSVWSSALEALRRADEWIMAGYSLPSEDISIRSILLRAYRGREDPPHVRVVQPSEDEEVQQRYRFLFPECVFELGGFEKFIEELPKKLPKN